MCSMDWTSIITALIAALVPTGGITAIVTLRDKKTAALLENVNSVIGQWEKIADERAKRAAELKADLDKKEEIIQEQWREMSQLRNDLDHERTNRAVAELMRCDITTCKDRKPPFGQAKALTNSPSK